MQILLCRTQCLSPILVFHPATLTMHFLHWDEVVHLSIHDEFTRLVFPPRRFALSSVLIDELLGTHTAALDSLLLFLSLRSIISIVGTLKFFRLFREDIFLSVVLSRHVTAILIVKHLGRKPKRPDDLAQHVLLTTLHQLLQTLISEGRITFKLFVRRGGGYGVVHEYLLIV